MVSIDDVAELALALPGVTEGERHGHRTWSVGGQVFGWERPFSKADVRRFGDDPVPLDPIVAVRLSDLHEKQAVLHAGHAGFFTISHFDNYAAVLVELGQAVRAEVAELIVDGWASRAPAEEVARHRRA